MKLSKSELTKVQNALKRANTANDTAKIAELTAQITAHEQAIASENSADDYPEHDDSKPYSMEIASFELALAPIRATDDNGNIRRKSDGTEDEREFHAILTFKKDIPKCDFRKKYLQESEMYALAKNCGCIDPFELEDMIRDHVNGNFITVNVVERTVGETYSRKQGKRTNIFTIEPNDNRKDGDTVYNAEINFFDPTAVLVSDDFTDELKDARKVARETKYRLKAEREMSAYESRVQRQRDAKKARYAETIGA